MKNNLQNSFEIVEPILSLRGVLLNILNKPVYKFIYSYYYLIN